VPAAILAGDALLTLAVEVLQPAASPAATDAVTLAVQDLIAGQSKDLEFERRRDVTLHECVDMANGKTSALMRCAASIGAILAGASAERVDLLARFGMHLGLAFQLVDDLLGICGAPEVTGKAVLADLKVRKKSLPVVAALTSGTAAGDELAARYLVEGVPEDEELPEFARLIEQAGGLAWAEAEADRQVAAAGECLDAVGAPEDVREALWQITHFVAKRDQ
jgi:geranylgeranyl diphosphate synthase type I